MGRLYLIRFPQSVHDTEVSVYYWKDELYELPLFIGKLSSGSAWYWRFSFSSLPKVQFTLGVSHFHFSACLSRYNLITWWHLIIAVSVMCYCHFILNTRAENNNSTMPGDSLCQVNLLSDHVCYWLLFLQCLLSCSSLKPQLLLIISWILFLRLCGSARQDKVLFFKCSLALLPHEKY